jgi:hypothetical protein
MDDITRDTIDKQNDLILKLETRLDHLEAVAVEILDMLKGMLNVLDK